MVRPLLALAFAVAGGALAGQGATDGEAGVLLAGAAGLVLLALGAGPSAAWAALLASGVAVGAASAAVERAAYDRAPLRKWVEARERDGPVHLTGIAAADGREAGDRWVIIVDVDTVAVDGHLSRLPGRARVDVGGQSPRAEILEGDELSLWVHLRLPRRPGTPGAFDPEAHARRQGIHVLGFCKSPRLVEREPGHGAAAVCGRARGWARSALRRFVPSGPEQGLVRAMVLGDRTGVDSETGEAFRVAGIYHVLAISGAQVALVAFLLNVVLRRLRWGPVPSALAIALAIAWYAELVGGDIPVVRSAVMAIALAAGRALDLDGDLANLLGLAAVVLLVHRPSGAGDVGFQLSFAATLGILLLAPPLLVHLPRLPLRLEAAIAASLAAQAAITPLLVVQFHRLCPAGLLLNLAAVPLSAATLLLGAAVLPVAPALPWLAARVGEAAWLAAHGLLACGRASLLVPALDVRPADPPVLAVAAYVAGLVSVLRGRGRLGLGWVGGGLTALVLGAAPPPADGRLHVTVLDVGQGDCLVIRSPAGHVLMVDAGGSYAPASQTGERVVGPYLWALGVRRIDVLVLTHAHPDHVGGARFLLNTFPVGEVWEGPAPASDPWYRDLDDALAAAGVPRRTVSRGVRTSWDGVAIDVLGPGPVGRRPWKTRNDDSLVLRLEQGRVRILLAGDVEGRGEAALDTVPADVLKVPHHGSRSSSTPAFVAASSPRVALASVGFRNRFGHPHPEVVERYRRAGAAFFRTDLDGAVTVSTDGRRVWIRSARSGAETVLP